MDTNIHQKLKEYSQAAIKLTKRYLDLKGLEFDHVCYQTVSKKDYREALNELKKNIKKG